METPFKLDNRTECPKCQVNPLRAPLVFNATDPATGKYWCVTCDKSATSARIYDVFRGRF